MRLRVLALAALAASFLGTHAEAARRPRRPWKKWKKLIEDSKVPIPRAGDSEEALKWLTDFDEAAELAGREKRPMMVLFTTAELMQKNRFCRFAANSVRRAVRKSKAVPVRILPPVRLSLTGIDKEEAAKRKKLYARNREKYRALVKRFGVTRGPSLIFTAPDGTKLTAMVVPTDDQIRAALGRLGEMVEAHQKTVAKKGGDGKAKGADDDKGDKKVAVKPAGGDQEPAKKGGQEPVDPEDDF